MLSNHFLRASSTYIIICRTVLVIVVQLLQGFSGISNYFLLLCYNISVIYYIIAISTIINSVKEHAFSSVSLLVQFWQ